MNTEIDEAAMTTLVAMSQVPEKFSAIEIKNFYENIISKLPCIVGWKDKDFKYVFCNEVTAFDLLKFNSPSEIIGKTDFELGFSVETAKSLRQIDEEIIKTGKPALNIETIFEMDDGRNILLSTNRTPLLDSAGEVVGIVFVSIDITAEKETIRLKFEAQQAALQEKEKLITLAHKVVHDISSPLSALGMMIPSCTELPEKKRIVIKRVAESILDIANNLLSTYRSEEGATSGVEERQPLLISDLIQQLLSEKKAQFSNKAVQFETDIADEAQFAFALMQPSQFRRSMSNLINNAVDALDNKSHGLVTINLTVDVESIVITIQDNGKGMSTAMIHKMMNRQSFTEGKANGHGLGLQQVWDTLDTNEGKIIVNSSPNEGTTIQITFPRVDAASWIAQNLQLKSNSIIVILDDEESIHGAWDMRLAPYLKSHSNLHMHHFKQGKETLDFFRALSTKEKECVVFLSDYELLRQDKNGLQIIEESGIKKSTLVTSYYTDTKIRNKAIELGVKILPKQMASIVPIEVDLGNPQRTLKSIFKSFIS
jgi:PAS domain S-box-containing protein